MSHTHSPAAAQARDVRQLIKGTAAAFTGKQRGLDGRVRRHSYDVDDRRAQPWRPIGDGTTSGALDWIDALVQTAEEYDRHHKTPGSRGGLGGPHVVAVLKALLGRRGRIAIDFKTGRLDPAYDTLMAVTGFARSTIARALAKLEAHGFLSWVRRSRKVDAVGQFAPQREQTSNAYFFDFAKMAASVRQRLRDLIEIRRRRRATRIDVLAPPPPDPATPPAPRDSTLAAVLARVGALVESASPPNALYPASGVKG